MIFDVFLGMRKPFIGANWKMNMLGGISHEFLTHLSTYHALHPQKEILVFPSMPYLASLSDKFKGLIGAQNVCHVSGFAAMTGESSAHQLNDLGIEFALVGHSERRTLFLESDERLEQKISSLMDQNLGVVFCCGESIEVRNLSQHFAWVEKQLSGLLSHLTPNRANRVVIAYEPIWAIGTGKIPSYTEIEAMHSHIRSFLQNRCGSEAASMVRIIYGGSCNEKNAKEIFSLPNVDGGLIGGASMDWSAFQTICDSV